MRDISNIKQEIINYRRIVKPQRPTLRMLDRSNQRFAPQDLELYFDDIVDKSERIWDLLENYKEVVEALEETNESVIAHQFNDILRILTVFGRLAAADVDRRHLGDERRMPGGCAPPGSFSSVFCVSPRWSSCVAGCSPGLPPQALAVTSGGRPGRGPDIMWSPWRMDYVAGGEGEGFAGAACAFCELPAQRDDARTYILYRGERAFVVMNLYPYNNGHLMMVPYAHEASWPGSTSPPSPS